jgi:arylsulfatase
MAMPEELHYNRFIADTTIDAIGRARRADTPFFIWCSFPDPHHPFAPPEPYASMYDPAECAAPEQLREEQAALPPYYRDVYDGTLRPNGVDNRPLPTDHILEMIARTYGMISHVDSEIGRIVAALERSGLLEDTAIVFTGDHGDMMGDHGLILKGPYTFAGCINTPLIISAPGRTAGAVSDSLVSQIDLMPTILDLCDVPMPGSDWSEQETPFERGTIDPISLYPGRSAAPLLADPTQRMRDDVVIENDDPTTGFRVRAFVTDRYRLTVYPGFPFGELFDLASDPGEHRNLWDREPSLRNELVRRLLDAYSASTPLHPIPPWNS